MVLCRQQVLQILGSVQMEVPAGVVAETLTLLSQALASDAVIIETKLRHPAGFTN